MKIINIMYRIKKIVCLVFVASSSLTFNARAALFTWDGNGPLPGTGGTGIWGTTTPNWDAGVNTWPVAGNDNDALFDGTAGTVTVQGAGIIVNDIRISSTGYTIEGGLITITNTALWNIDADVHALFSAPILQTMFPFTKTGRGTLEFANGCTTWDPASDSQLFNITNGTLIVSGGIFGGPTGSRRIRVGSGPVGGPGSMRQTGGLAHFGTVDGQWMIGAGTLYGFYSLEDGTLTATNGASTAFRFAVRTGAMYQSGGAISVNLGLTIKSQAFTIGTDSSPAAGGATVYSTNGTADIAVLSGVTQQGIGVGAKPGSNGGGWGQLTLDGSADWSNAGYTQVGYTGDFFGALNLNENARLTSSYVSGQGISFISFNGGTLRAGSATATFLKGFTNAQINANGAIIDSQNYTITIPQNLLAPTGNSVTGIALTDGGTGYLGAPVVKITGGGGFGATAIAEWNALTKTITGIKVTNPGSGYTSEPTVAFIANSGAPTAEATMGTVVIGTLPSGGLTKKGAGTLTLTGTNTYTGTTMVNEGTLVISTEAINGGNIVVADTASLRAIANSTTPIAPNAISLGSSTGATLEFSNVSSTTIPPILASGAITLAGTTTINILPGTFVRGSTYPLMRGNSLTGSYILGQLPVGVTGTLSTDIDAKTIILSITGAPLTWNGNIDGIWDINTTANWMDELDNMGLKYMDLPVPDSLRFDDSATGETNLMLNTVVSPTDVLFTNSTKTYTLAGMGKISGSTSVTKSGSKSVTFVTDNDYTGSTTILAGTLQVGVKDTASGSLGSASVSNNSSLYFDRSGSYSIGNVFSGTGITGIRYGGNMTLTSRGNTNNGWRVSNGSFTLPNNSDLTILTGDFMVADKQNSGYASAPTNLSATVTIENGASLTVNALVAGNGTTVAGGSMTSTIIQNGGTVRTTGNAGEDNGIRLAHWGQANSTYTMNGGSLTVEKDWDLCLATDGTGTLHQVSGDIYTKRVMLNERFDMAGRGFLKVSGGTLHLGTGTGSMLVSSNGIASDQASTNCYRVELGGGSGGTIQAHANIQIAADATLMGPTPITFNADMFAVTIQRKLSGTGGLIKTGSGALTLSGTNTYSGGTTLSTGTLTTTTDSSGNGTFTAADSTTLGVVIRNGGSLAMSSLALGTSGNTIFLFNNITSTQTPPVNVSGAVAVGGTSTIQIQNNIPLISANYPLIKYGSLAGTGTFTLAPLPQGINATLTTNEIKQIIYLTVSSVDTLVWDGDVSDVWEIAGDANWKNTFNDTLQYLEAPTPDMVRFDDTATGSGIVTLNVTVSPSHITVENTSKNYTITGTGGIAGNTPLVKSGSGTLILATANAYAGQTTINSGTLQVGNGGTGGSLGSGGIINNASLIYNRSDSQTWGQTISGTGNMIKSGTTNTAILTLGAANSYSGGTTLSSGILQVNHSDAVGTGPIIFNGGRRLSLGTGVILTNAITIGSNTGEGGNGLIQASAGTPELRGPITINTGAVGGGHFAGVGGDLSIKGAITSETATVVFRTGTGAFSGGGSYTNLSTSGTVRLGASNGISTTAVMSVAFSEAGLFNLNGFSQTLAGLTRVNTPSSLTNSIATTVTLTLNNQSGVAHSFASPVIGKINILKWGGGQQTFSGVTNAINQIDIKQGTLSLNGIWSNTGTFNVGGDTPDTATLKILGGTLSCVGNAHIGAAVSGIGFTGQVIQTSGTIVSAAAIRTATDTNLAWASYTLSGGSIDLTSTSASYLLIGRDGKSTFDQSGGSIRIARSDTASINNSALIIGFQGTSLGAYTLSGGSITVTNGGYGTVIGINSGSQGTMTITNSGIANMQSTILAYSTGANGTLNMHGGDLRFNTLKGGSGNRTFNWRAGTLRPLTSNKIARIESTLPLTLVSSNAIFATRDALDYEATLVVDSVISEQGGSFGFDKTRAGNLILTATNTYSGTTFVTFGTLYANNANPAGSATGSGSVTVRAGAVLGGTGSCAGAVTIATGGGINPGTTNTTPSTLTIGSLTFQANTTNTFDCVVATKTCDNVSVSDALTIQGTGCVALSYSGTTPPSKMPIATFNSISGTEYLRSWTVMGSSIDPAIQKYKVFVEGKSLFVGDQRGTLMLLK